MTKGITDVRTSAKEKAPASTANALVASHVGGDQLDTIVTASEAELSLMEHQAQEPPYYQSNVELDPQTVLTVRSRIANGDTRYRYQMVGPGWIMPTLSRDDALGSLQALIARDQAAAVVEAGMVLA